MSWNTKLLDLLSCMVEGFSCMIEIFRWSTVLSNHMVHKNFTKYSGFSEARWRGNLFSLFFSSLGYVVWDFELKQSLGVCLQVEDFFHNFRTTDCPKTVWWPRTNAVKLHITFRNMHYIVLSRFMSGFYTVCFNILCRFYIDDGDINPLFRNWYMGQVLGRQI